MKIEVQDVDQQKRFWAKRYRELAKQLADILECDSVYVGSDNRVYAVETKRLP